MHLTGAQAAEQAKPELPLPVTPQEAAKKFLELGADTTQVAVDGTTTIAGQPAYELRVKPKQSGSTISEVRIAVAAENGVPLAVQVRSGSTKVLDARFSEVSFATPSADTFRFTAPEGAKVTERKAEENAGVGTPCRAAPDTTRRQACTPLATAPVKYSSASSSGRSRSRS